MSGLRGGDHVHGSLSVFGGLQGKTHLLQDHLRDLHIDGVVLHQQKAFSREIHRLLVRRPDSDALFVDLLILRQPELEAEKDLRAAAGGGEHLDGAAHHIHDALGDRQPKTGAFHAAVRGTAFALKGAPHPLDKFLGHADAVVLNTDLIGAVAVRRAAQLVERGGDRAAVVSEFVGVGEEIQQHPVKIFTVAPDPAVLDLGGVDGEIHLLLLHLLGKQVVQGVQDAAQIGGSVLQLHLSALDAAHLQNVIDERQQMLAGALDLRQIVALRIGGRLLQSEVRIAQDRVHGRPDVVGHVEKEPALGKASLHGADLLPLGGFMHDTDQPLDV